jgi:hypothetical protein
MMDDATLERGLRARPPADPMYRSRITATPPTVLHPVAIHGRRRATAQHPGRFLAMNGMLKIAAVAVLALAVGIGVLQLRPSTDQIGAAPSPSPSPSPLVWTPASIEEDWPEPVREEPVGDPVVIPIADGYLDPRGDIASPDMPWIDILRVQTGNTGARVYPGAGVPSGLVVPSGPWIAYGLVFDTDLDGVADVRLGIDILPAELTPWGGGRAPGDIIARAWRTDLRTGVTEYGHAGVSVLDGGLGDEGRPVVKLYPYNDGSADGYGKLPGRFYAWASVIQDGRVVATDYAPDTGWLVPTVKPEPTGSPAP